MFPVRAPGENVVCSEGGVIVVRRLDSLALVHGYRVQDTQGVASASSVSAFSLCPLNHHAFVATDDGGVLIYGAHTAAAAPNGRT